MGVTMDNNGSMTSKDLKWARSHDWGTKAYLMGSTLWIPCIDNTGSKRLYIFKSLRALRVWAGY